MKSLLANRLIIFGGPGSGRKPEGMANHVWDQTRRVASARANEASRVANTPETHQVAADLHENAASMYKVGSDMHANHMNSLAIHRQNL